MRRIYQLGMMLCLGVLAACSTVDVEVLENEMEAGSYRSYSWSLPPLEPSEEADREELPLYLIDQRVRREVNRELQARGYRAVDKSAQPELLVDYRISQKMGVSERGPISPVDELDRAWAGPASASSTNIAHYNHAVLTLIEENMLQLTVLDAKRKRVIWQSLATTVVEEEQMDEDGIRQLVELLVSEAMAQLPMARVPVVER